MRTPHTALALVLALGAGLGSAQAQSQSRQFDISFTNVFSSAERGSDENSSFTVQLAPQAYLRALSWTADVTAFEPSWLSELTLELTNTRGEGVQLSPADGLNAAGRQLTSGRLDLVNTGLGFRLLADGRLQLAFTDAVDDLPGLPDGRWNSATLHIDYTAPVPEPAAGLLLATGLAGLAALAVRRRRAAPAVCRAAAA